jgi:hypothetical protein
MQAATISTRPALLLAAAVGQEHAPVVARADDCFS